MTTQNTQTGTARFFVPTTRRQWMYVIAAGLAAGIVAWLGGILLTSWVFTPLFCQATDSIALCATTEFAGTHTATIFAIVLGSIILIRSDIVRPLLVSIAAGLVLWGLQLWGFPSDLAKALVVVLLYPVVYAALFWLTRPNKAWLALVLALAFVVITKIATL